MENPAIFIGLGSNLPSRKYGDPAHTCQAALDALAAAGVEVVKVSRWYRSAPVPVSDQPWFVNGVAMVNTGLAPAALLALLHRIEQDFGRERRARDEARVIDLDILAYGDQVSGPRCTKQNFNCGCAFTIDSRDQSLRDDPAHVE